MSISQVLVSLGTFFLLVGYEGIRSPSNTLFQQMFGIAKFPLVLAAVPLFFLPIHAIYSWSLSRYGNRVTLLFSNFFSCIVLALLQVYSSKQNAVAVTGLVIFREVYIVLILEQLWSYINSVTSLEKSKSVHSMFSGLGNLGGAFGGVIVGKFAITFGTHQMIWLTQLGLALCFCFLFFGIKEISAINSRDPQVAPFIPSSGSVNSKIRFGLDAFKRFPILGSILSLVMLSQFCITTSNLSLQALYKEMALLPDQQTSFSGMLYSWISFGSITLQFLAAPFILKFLAPVRVQLLIPTLGLTFHLIGLYSGSLVFVALAFGSLKAMDYSLFRISKEILFIPLDFEARFPAKQLIDTIGYRSAKAFMSLLLAGFTWFGFESSNFFLILTLSTILVWLLLARRTSHFRQS